MSNWGMPTSTRWGDPSDHFQTFSLADFRDGARMRFQALTGWEQYVRAVCDGEQQGPALYTTAGQIVEARIVYATTTTPHACSVAGQGDWTDDARDVTAQQAFFLNAREARIWASITSSIIGYMTVGDNFQLSSWSLSGVSRFTNCMSVVGSSTWARLNLTISNSGTTRTVTLLQGTLAIASGSRTGDGSITLTASNNSGVSGSVSIVYTGDISSGGYVIARFPASFKVHHRTSAFTAPDFPRTAEGTVYDDGHSRIFKYRSAVQTAAGTYYVVVHEVDENGNEGTGIQGGGATVAIVIPPAPPGRAAYVSGDQSNTVVSWTASATSGVTYNIYDSGPTGSPLPATYWALYSGTSPLTLNTLATPTFTGTRYILVRATKGGTEEGNTQILEIPYASGAVVLRPPIPRMDNLITRSGRALTVTASVSTTEQAAAGVTLQLFVVAYGSSINYASAQATASLSGLTAIQGVIKKSVTYTAPGDGNYIYAVRTITSGSVQSTNTDTYGPVVLTTAIPGDPTPIDVRPGV